MDIVEHSLNPLTGIARSCPYEINENFNLKYSNTYASIKQLDKYEYIIVEVSDKTEGCCVII